jgi:hypothetical protein
MHKIEPGIEWQQTSGNTHRVTIRREPEYVFDQSDLDKVQQANLAQISALAQIENSNTTLAQLGVGFGTCPCCGQPNNTGVLHHQLGIGSPALFGGIFGSTFG